jgi:hypothetical protein
MNEAFLFYVWQFQYFTKGNLQTTDGEDITVIHPGTLNSHSGPDFFNAKIKIGAMEWIGNVEIHINASHWFDHHHNVDSAYENVVLHVVWKNDHQIARQDGSMIPTLELKSRVNEKLLLQYRRLVNNPHSIPCSPSLKNVKEITKLSMLDKAVMQRLESKASHIQMLFEKNNNDWEQTTYEALARNFGFKVNAEPFEQLAQALPYRIILKHLNQPTQVEAMLFGQAGLLEQLWSDEYFLILKREYSFLSKKYQNTSGKLNKAQWRFMRMRPANFPTIRMSQFSSFLCSQQNIFSKVIECTTYQQLQSLFSVAQSEYWKFHYQFFKPVKEEIPSLGKQSIDNILINTVVPLFVAYGKSKDDQSYVDRAVDVLTEIEPEINTITKQWAALGMVNESALDSQALIELYNSFCVKRKCLDCAIGFSLMQPLLP